MITPHCYFCGREIVGTRTYWTEISRPGGFNINVAACRTCAEDRTRSKVMG